LKNSKREIISEYEKIKERINSVNNYNIMSFEIAEKKSNYYENSNIIKLLNDFFVKYEEYKEDTEYMEEYNRYKNKCYLS